jgi:exopolysaccharide biosynthesis polyprenyl glycosylphosphotransferase
VDFVVLGPSQERFDEIQNLIAICETEGVEAWILGAFFTTSIARPSVDEFQDLPMLTFRTAPAMSWALVTKRGIDVIGALALIAVTAPVMAAVALAVKLGSTGSVLFAQQRCSLRGRRFWMYKFRTMVNDAEALRGGLDAHNEMEGPVFKIRHDPRITAVGRFLRRYSIDELPQLFNVLKGDMSLVGPRPPIPSEVADYESWHRRRLSMRTGLTGLWQTAGRNTLPFDDWMKLDLEYIDNWSLALDFKILLRTPVAIVRGTGF